MSIRPLPGASKNAATATASSTKTTNPMDEPRILIERGHVARLRLRGLEDTQKVAVAVQAKASEVIPASPASANSAFDVAMRNIIFAAFAEHRSKR